MKSQPVPRAITAIATPSLRAIPFATSLTEPSPPTTTRSFAPSSAASAASSPSRPGRSEKRTSPVRPRAAASRWICGHRRRVAPLSEAGLTRKTVLSLMLCGGNGRQRDARHPVYRGAELVVGDPLELALHHNVADRQQAAGLDAAERTEREEHGSLHL